MEDKEGKMNINKKDTVWTSTKQWEISIDLKFS